MPQEQKRWGLGFHAVYEVDRKDRVVEIDSPQSAVGAPLPLLVAAEGRLLLAYLGEVSDPRGTGRQCDWLTPNQTNLWFASSSTSPGRTSSDHPTMGRQRASSRLKRTSSVQGLLRRAVLMAAQDRTDEALAPTPRCGFLQGVAPLRLRVPRLDVRVHRSRLRHRGDPWSSQCPRHRHGSSRDGRTLRPIMLLSPGSERAALASKRQRRSAARAGLDFGASLADRAFVSPDRSPPYSESSNPASSCVTSTSRSRSHGGYSSLPIT